MPPSKTGKVVWAWPRIVDALQSGWRLADVWEALRKDGIEMPYNQFRVYVSRIRRRAAKSASEPRPSPAHPDEVRTDNSAGAESDTRRATGDPYSAIRRQRKLKQRSGFEYDPFSTDKDLLE
jgi:hypothetical protein